MAESSNYDAAPPVPPAYGVWKKIGPRKYEAKYQYFQSRAVASAEEIAVRNATKGFDFPCRVRLSPRQRAILAAGGLLNYTREGGR